MYTDDRMHFYSNPFYNNCIYTQHSQNHYNIDTNVSIFFASCLTASRVKSIVLNWRIYMKKKKEKKSYRTRAMQRIRLNFDIYVHLAHTDTTILAAIELSLCTTSRAQHKTHTGLYMHVWALHSLKTHVHIHIHIHKHGKEKEDSLVCASPNRLFNNVRVWYARDAQALHQSQ